TGSMAVAVRGLAPSTSGTPVAVNEPALTVATTPLTITAALSSLIVPVTVMGLLLTRLPSAGVVIVTTGGVVSRVTCTLAIPGFPAGSVAVHVTGFDPSLSETPVAVKVPGPTAAGT